MPFTYAIADLHGRYDPLSEAVTKIAGALSRAIARRERPPPAIGIEAKSCSEFRAEEVPFLIIDPRGQGQLPPWLRRTNVWLRVTNSARWARRLRSEPPIDVQHGLRPRRRLDEAARRA